mmetsp:Transcript_79779/g.220630  ORF Transcript_79779/g.220630 Transcript_79779/m.220630 type:complete len:213 (-) Transcript_79779:87-725(-)
MRLHRWVLFRQRHLPRRDEQARRQGPGAAQREVALLQALRAARVGLQPDEGNQRAELVELRPGQVQPVRTSGHPGGPQEVLPGIGQVDRQGRSNQGHHRHHLRPVGPVLCGHPGHGAAVEAAGHRPVGVQPEVARPAEGRHDRQRWGGREPDLGVRQARVLAGLRALAERLPRRRRLLDPRADPPGRQPDGVLSSGSRRQNSAGVRAPPDAS